MAKVGVAYIEIRPDLSGFAQELKARLAAMRQPEVEVRPDVDSFGARVREGVRRQESGLRAVGVRISDVIGGGLAGAWKTSGNKRFFAALSQMSDGIVGVLTTPIGLAAAALAAVFAAGFVGALIPALAGAGLIGLGAYLVKDVPAVRKAATQLGKTASKAFRDAAKPFIVPITNALKVLERSAALVADILKPAFAGLAPLIVPLANAFSVMGEDIARGLVAALPGMTAALSAFADALPELGVAIGDMFRMLGEHPEEIKTIISSTMSALIAVIRGVTRFLDVAIDLTAKWRETLSGVKDRLREALDSEQAGKMKEQLQGVGEQMSTAFKGENLVGVTNLVTSLKESFSSLWTIVQPILTKLFTIFTTQLVPMFAQLWTEAQPVLTQLGQTFSSIFEFIGVLIKQATDLWFAIWDRFGVRILGGIKQALSGVLTSIRGVLQIIQGIFQVLTGLLTGNWEKAWTGIKNILGGALKVVQGQLNTMIGAVKAVWFTFVGWLSTVFGDAWNKITSTVRTGFNTVVSILRGLPGAIMGALGNLGSLLYNAGVSVVEGLANGIKNSWNKVSNAVTGLLNKIPKAVRDLLGIGSPSKVMARLGREVPRGFARGIIGESPAVTNALKSMMGLAATRAPIGSLAPQGSATPSVLAVLSIDGKFFDLRVEQLITAGADIAARDLLAGRRSV
jgi:phage-related protein